MGALGFTAAPFPESVGGAGFSYRAWTLDHGGDRPRPTWPWRSRSAVHILSQYPVVTWGTDGAAGALAAGDAGRRGAGRLRPDRAPRRLRCRRPAPARDAGGSGRRADRLPPRPGEDLDHQRPRRRALPRLRHARPRARARRHHRLPGRAGHAGLRLRARTSGRWASGPARRRAPSSTAARSRPRTGSAARARAIGSPSRRSGRGASRSPPPASGWRRPRWTPRRAT